MDIKERFIATVEALGMTVNAFEKSANIARGTIGRLNFGIHSDKLANIARVYPQVNLRWLLLGEKPIIIGAMDADAEQEEYRDNEALIEDLQARVARMGAEIEWLRGVVDAESRAIAALTGQTPTSPEE